MNQAMTTSPSIEEGTSFDGMANFLMYKEQSAKFKGSVVYPSGDRAKIVNPNAKPIKLNPPK